MKVSRRVLTRYIAARLHDSEDRAEVIKSLAAYIVEHGLQTDLELILSDIALNLARLGSVQAAVITARPLDETLRAEVVRFIKQIEAAQNVSIAEAVDPDLLGGIIIETPNKRFDASVSTKLKRLRNA